MLEATQYSDNAFVTLTYDEKSLPILAPSGLSSLMPEHLRNFLKRLRKKVSPVRIRFYACGEYGETTERPHYHAALFNLPTCERGRTLRRVGSGRPLWAECCSVCLMVGETWGLGDVDLGILETASAQYVAGYVTKKMTHRQHPWLKGREPEFARMSNRPGIGADAMFEVADTLMRFSLDTRAGDVPVTLRHGSRELPLGRYLRRRLRKMIGKEENTPAEVLAEIAEAMRPLRETAFDASVSFASEIKKESKGQIARFHARNSIFKGKKSL